MLEPQLMISFCYYNFAFIGKDPFEGLKTSTSVRSKGGISSQEPCKSKGCKSVWRIRNHLIRIRIPLVILMRIQFFITVIRKHKKKFKIFNYFFQNPTKLFLSYQLSLWQKHRYYFLVHDEYTQSMVGKVW